MKTATSPGASRDTLDAPLRERPSEDSDAPFARSLFREERRSVLAAHGVAPHAAETLADLQLTSWWAALTAQAAEQTTWTLDGAPVAHLAVRERAEETRLVWIAVEPQHRGQGLAERMLTPLLARSHAARRPVTLLVDPLNTSALTLYTRLGFTEHPGSESAADLFLSTYGSSS